MKTLAAIFLCAFAALITLAVFAVQGWMMPLQPLLFGAVLITLPSVVAMFVLEPAARRAPWSIAALTVIGGILVGVIFPSLWLSPKVRLAALERTSDPQALLAALDDASEFVQVRSCQRLFETGVSAAEITSELTSRPGLALKCLAEDSIASRSVAARMATNWQDRLIHDSVETCIEAEAVTAIQGVSTESKAVGFLECALTASDPNARVCCINELSDMKSVEHVQQWVETSRPEMQRRHLTATLMLVSHREPITMKEQHAGIAQIGLNSPEMKYVTLSQACEALVTGENAKSVMSGIDWIFAQHESCLSEEEKSANLDTIDACRLIMAGEYQDLDRQICAANQYSRRDELAKIKAAAERAANSDFGSLAGDIVSGNNKLANKASLGGFMDAAMGGGTDLKNFNAADLARIKGEISSQVAKAPTKDEIKKIGNDDRMKELRANPKTKELFNMKTPEDVARVKAEFEAREKAATKGRK